MEGEIKENICSKTNPFQNKMLHTTNSLSKYIYVTYSVICLLIILGLSDKIQDTQLNLISDEQWISFSIIMCAMSGTYLCWNTFLY